MKKENTKDIERYELKDNSFNFSCNENVPCFTRCCRDADMFLYPYDIIRLKQHLGMTSDEFLVTHTMTAFRDNPNFPNVMLKMSDAKGNPCSFLSEKGCTVYENRPFSCRAYPLEPALHGDGKDGFAITSYIVRHAHCKGHDQGEDWTADQWMDNQGMTGYNQYNSAWARVAAFLHSENPYGKTGPDNPAMNMAYMASYNMDTFRRFVLESSFLQRFDISDERLAEIKKEDTALMLLGFDWIMSFLGGQKTLKEK